MFQELSTPNVHNSDKSYFFCLKMFFFHIEMYIMTTNSLSWQAIPVPNKQLNSPKILNISMSEYAVLIEYIAVTAQTI